MENKISVDGNNSININKVEKDNKVEINQTNNNFIQDRPIEFKKTNLKEVSREDIKKSIRKTESLTAITIIASIITIFQFLGVGASVISSSVILFFAVIICTVSTEDSKNIIKKAKKGTMLYLRNSIFVELTSSNDYKMYEFVAKCGYHNCTGDIVLEEAPPREKPNINYAGKCTLGQNAHSYAFDNTGYGYKRAIDWRPIEEIKVEIVHRS